MNGYDLTISYVRALVRDVGATDRWRALRDAGQTRGQTSLLWWAVIAVVLAAAVGVVVALVYEYRRRRREQAEFARQGLQAGLREAELKILARVVKLARLKNPSTIYTAGGTFDTAAAHLLASRKVADSSAQAQADLKATLMSMRMKLRFGPSRDGDDLDVLTSSRQMPTGSNVFVAKPGQRESVEATIVGNSRTELLIMADEPLPGRKGAAWTIRHARGHAAWEFDTRVLRYDGQRAAIEHSRDVRGVNFRRFPRVATEMQAGGTVFPFHTDSDEISLDFMPVSIVEIAGPGLLIKLPLELEIGQSILVRVQLDEHRAVQGLAKVRRIVTNKPGGPFAAVEFVELAPEELAELTRMTNLAAARKTHLHAAIEMAVV